MDSQYLYSAGQVCNDLTLSSSISAFESCWFSHFWSPVPVQVDNYFKYPAFLSMMTEHSIYFRPVSPLRQFKNVLESKHGIIRSIFLRLLTAENPPLPVLADQRYIRISNVLYVSGTYSDFEMANVFSRPLANIFQPIIYDIFEAQKVLPNKKKQARILRAKSNTDIQISPGDLVEPFVLLEGQIWVSGCLLELVFRFTRPVGPLRFLHQMVAQWTRPLKTFCLLLATCISFKPFVWPMKLLTHTSAYCSILMPFTRRSTFPLLTIVNFMDSTIPASNASIRLMSYTSYLHSLLLYLLSVTR